MSLRQFIVDQAIELDNKINGGYSTIPIVHDPKGYGLDIKRRLVKYFKQPPLKLRQKYLNETSELITEEIIKKTYYINNAKYREQAYSALIKESREGLEAMIMPDSNTYAHKILRGRYILAARDLPLPKVSGDKDSIYSDPYYNHYTVIYYGFAQYLLHFRYFI